MKTGTAFILCLLFSASVTSQCPDGQILYNRIIFLRDTSQIEPGKQLKELLGYQKKMAQCSYKNDSIHALLLQRIGWLYTSENDYFNAIQYTQKSLAIIKQRKNNPAINPSLAIKCYYNLSLMYEALKLVTKKVTALDSCISEANYLNAWNVTSLAAIALKVEQLFIIGDYFNCITYATLGERICYKISPTKAAAEESIVDYNFSALKTNALIFTNNTGEAAKVVTSKIRFAEDNRKINLSGVYYGLYASVLRQSGKPVEAIAYFKKCLDYNTRIHYHPGCAQALNNIGFVYSNNLLQYKKALTYYFKALTFSDANESLNILDNIANIYVKTGKYDSAFLFFQKAFDQLQTGFTEKDLLKNENEELSGSTTEYLTGMVLDKAAAWLSKYKATGDKNSLGEAVRIYEITDHYFDKLKTWQSDIQSKLFWKTNNRRLYEQAIEACYANMDKEKAFYFFEKSRSTLLNDQIMEQRRMSDADLSQQAQLQKNVLETERGLQKVTSSSQQSLDLQKQLLTNKRDLELFIKKTGAHSSFAYNYADARPITLEAVRKKILALKTSLLEIFSGDSSVYLLFVGLKNASFVKLDKALYDSLTAVFISYIADAGKLNRNFSAFTNASNQLYKLIFGKIPLASGGSLSISPDGKSFPFEALVTDSGNREPAYFLNYIATSYTYSAQYLINDYADNVKNSKGVLGMAPVKYNDMALSGLPGSDISLQNIKSTFSKATNFVFENATKNNFLQHFADYNIIQLYTHAEGSSINSDPVIYFADSALYLSDLIPDRKPLTQLVVLSACETANGKLYEGEGVFSFNRGFAALGIPAAVSNLWLVENGSTYRITELFYKYLSHGLPTDIALQKAKIEFINTSPSKEKSLPYFWAGCILTGKVDTVEMSMGFPWRKVIIASVILSVLVCLLIFFYRKYRTRMV